MTHPVLLFGALADAYMVLALREHEARRWAAWSRASRRAYLRELWQERQVRKASQ